MANINSPRGLIARQHGNGGLARVSILPYQIAGALASNIYRGSAVIPVNTNRRIDVAAAGGRVIGAFWGVSFVDGVSLQPMFLPRWPSGQTLVTGTIAEAQVFDDPDIIFECQVSSASGLVATDVGNFADLVIGTGNALTGNSGDMVDQTTLTSTIATGGQVRVEGLSPFSDNEFGQYAKALVRFNEHFLRGSTTAGQATTPV